MTAYGRHTTTTAGTTWKECHKGVNLVFTTHDGIEVYAGGSSRSGGWLDYKLLYNIMTFKYR